MKIILDKREQKTREFFSRAFPLEYEEKILEIGDLAADWFDRLILVEFKIGADMLQIQHLRDQISRMSEEKWHAWEKHLIITREGVSAEDLLRIVKMINGQCFLGGIYLHVRDRYETDLIGTILDILQGKYITNKRSLELPAIGQPLAVRWLACTPGITAERAQKIVEEIKKESPTVGMQDLVRELLVEDELGQCVLDRVFGLTVKNKRKKIVESIREHLKTGL